MKENFNKDPYKSQSYEAYVLWKSLPSFLKGQPRVVIEKFGVEEELTISLLAIRSQAEFSKVYNIDVGTLTDWNKRIEKDGLLRNVNAWAKKLTPNVIGALYKNIIKHGKAHEVKAWMEIVENN
jgi:hypothetical protein